MSRSYGKGQRSRTRLNIIDRGGNWMLIQGSLTKSSRKMLGNCWHTHHNSRLAERKSKHYVKQNAARARRRDGKDIIRKELTDD